MSEKVEDIEPLIDDYLDGRLDPQQRAEFEARMERDPELKGRVMSATRSLELIQQALGWVTPSDEFDNKVNSKIESITSGVNMQPAMPASERSLTSDDPDARLLGDPVAAQEKKRLMIMAIVAAIVFSALVCITVYAIARSAKPAATEQRR